MRPKKYKIKPTYKKESGVWVLDFKDLKLPDKVINKEKAMVFIPPYKFVANHKHPRTEYFMGIGNGLELFWLDDKNKRHKDLMNPDGNLFLFFIPSNLPHAVLNNDKTNALIIEFADKTQTLQDVERQEIIKLP